jgi:membrane protease YdiL (CAAX protease family)
MQIRNGFVRAILYWVSFLILLFGAGSLLSIKVQGNWWSSVYGVVCGIVAILATCLWAGWKWTALRDNGLLWQKGSLRRFLVGLGIGVAMIMLMILVLVVTTQLEWKARTVNWTLPLIIGSIAFFPLAYFEEVAFRGYPFNVLRQQYALPISQFIVAVAFALYHIAMGWNIMVAFMGPFVWSFLFGLAKERSGGIALPTGIHTALNVCQSLFGLKGSEGSLWSLTLPEGTSSAAQDRIDLVGILMHVCLLAILLVLTFRDQGRRTIIAT